MICECISNGLQSGIANNKLEFITRGILPRTERMFLQPGVSLSRQNKGFLNRKCYSYNRRKIFATMGTIYKKLQKYFAVENILTLCTLRTKVSLTTRDKLKKRRNQS